MINSQFFGRWRRAFCTHPYHVASESWLVSGTKKEVVCWPVAWGVQVWQCSHYKSGRTHWEFTEYLKTDMLISPLKTCDILPLLPIATVEPPLESTHFQTCLLGMLHARCFVKCYSAYYVIRRFLRWSIRHIQGVPGGMDKTSGECSLCWTIPI